MQLVQHSEESDLLSLPATPLAREVFDLVTRNASTVIANHSMRSFLFARLIAQKRDLTPGRDYDSELLFCACALHDMGLTQAYDRSRQRFEVDGADLAAELLKRHGVGASDVDLVWQAIALNTSVGIVERRGTLCALTLAGVSADFGADAAFIPNDTAELIHRAYPRLAIGRALADAVVAQAQKEPSKAPLFSMAAQLVRERDAAPHVTLIESIAAASRWRE